MHPIVNFWLTPRRPATRLAGQLAAKPAGGRVGGRRRRFRGTFFRINDPEAMLDHPDLQPVFFAPFVSSQMRIEPQWIDYNGHLNMAYYTVLFDRAVDELYALLGIGPDYLAQCKHSTMVAEMHVRYVREIHEGDPVRVTAQLLSYDAKRFHLFEQLFHATEGWLSATCESMTLHVDMTAKKVAPFPDDVMRALARLKAAHAALPAPEGAGRHVAMPEKR
jgi:acyl-CoA thioester hydrolase